MGELWIRIGEYVRIGYMRAKTSLENEDSSSIHPVLILASTSPRRQRLLGLGGWMFNILPADVDETPLPEESPQAYVARLAEVKARAAAPNTREGSVVIAADTTVADGDKILGKPLDSEEAEKMLKNLRGRDHQVFTSVAVYQPSLDNLETTIAETTVPMRDYSSEEIHTYIATGDPFDKAGSYAIQHPKFKPVESLTGCYANVVGLPLCHLLRTLEKFGITPQLNVPAVCQKTLDYECDVFKTILRGKL